MELKDCPITTHHSLVGSKVLEPPKDLGVQCFHDLLGMLVAPPIIEGKKKEKKEQPYGASLLFSSSRDILYFLMFLIKVKPKI